MATRPVVCPGDPGGKLGERGGGRLRRLGAGAARGGVGEHRAVLTVGSWRRREPVCLRACVCEVLLGECASACLGLCMTVVCARGHRRVRGSVRARCVCQPARECVCTRVRS